MEAVTAAGLESLTSQPPTLEELFLRHYGAPPESSPTPEASPQRGGEAMRESLVGTFTLVRLV